MVHKARLDVDFETIPYAQYIVVLPSIVVGHNDLAFITDSVRSNEAQVSVVGNREVRRIQIMVDKVWQVLKSHRLWISALRRLFVRVVSIGHVFCPDIVPQFNDSHRVRIIINSARLKRD